MNELSQKHPESVPRGRVSLLTLAALVSFASNSLLCRAALGTRAIDPITFTSLRLVSGALVLAVLAAQAAKAQRPSAQPSSGSRIVSAGALFLYAVPFSLAYTLIPAGTGAFVLFGCVQVTMIGADLMGGRRLGPGEAIGLLLAVGGLFRLTGPETGESTAGVMLMMVAGFAWGVYSIRGRTAGPPLQATARNFAIAAPVACVLSALSYGSIRITATGAMLAVASGAVTSGLGYVAWYAAIPSLGATRASILQLAVPPLAAAMGVIFLREVPSSRLLTAAPLILGGIALALATPKRAAT